MNDTVNTESLTRIATVLDQRPLHEGHYHNKQDLLFATCKLIGKHANIHFQRPVFKIKEDGLLDALQHIVAFNRIRMRKVTLNRQWWKTDNGSLLGSYRDNPCALIPRAKGGYEMIRLDTGEKVIIRGNIDGLALDAYYFYPALPEKITRFSTLVKFMLPAIKSRLWRVVQTQILISLFILIIPIITGALFDTVIPNAETGMLIQLTIALLFNLLVITLFMTAQYIALIRLRLQAQNRLQPALWSRLLQLPANFFKQFAAGDLAARASAVADIQDELSQSVVISILNGSMSIITLILMFIYSSQLATVTLGLTIIIIGISMILNMKRMQPNTAQYLHRNKLSGFVLELLSALPKLRVSNAEPRIFSLWSKLFVKKSKAEMQSLKYMIGIDVFTAGSVIFSTFVIYTVVILLGEQLSFGDFIVFNAAFVIFITSLTKAIDVISSSIEVIPLYKQMKPILYADTENEMEVTEPGELDGTIQIKNVAFRYRKNETPIFKNMSLDVKPGEFIALVGPSGSGKSTLFRLLLGFEQPEAGSILYNGINLQTLRLTSVRSQIGVVIQNSSLSPGTILDNILGSDIKLTREDAWKIAEQVGIAEMIHELPMGMDTMIIEGMNTLSGGEAQRLMLARALAKKPKVLFLDEATSALDNTTQALVHERLKQTQATQIIAAHRLSTIVHADCIHVIDKGEIIESGSYETLLAKGGLFKELIQRQLA